VRVRDESPKNNGEGAEEMNKVTADAERGASTLPERLSRNERIERKAKLLDRLDPEREVKLEDTFTNHLADAIRASGPTERQQEIDKATEAYEDALDGALYEIVDNHLADEESSVA
jgi:hypothetical protein